MKTVTEIISKPSDMPLKKNGGMVTLFYPATEEVRDFWPVDAKEAMKNGWHPKPEKVLLVESVKTVPAMSDAPIIPLAESNNPAVTDAVSEEANPVGGTTTRKSRRGYASEPSDTK